MKKFVLAVMAVSVFASAAMATTDEKGAGESVDVDALQKTVEWGGNITPKELKAWLDAKKLKKYEEYVCPFREVTLFGPIDKDTSYGPDPGSRWWGFDIGLNEIRSERFGTRESMVLGYEQLMKCKARNSSGFAAGYGHAAAMANRGQGDYAANQVIPGMGVLGGSAPLGGNDEKLEDWAGRQKRADVECSGITYLHRPLWQRILSFGVLGEVKKATEHGVWSAPGGTDAIKLLMQRNPEFNLLIAKAIKYGIPEAFASAINCTSSIGGDVDFLYTLNNGLPHLEITTPE